MVVFTHGLEVSPFSTAFLASRAAPSMTSGLDVLVHDVIAAITTAPWSRMNRRVRSDLTSTGLLGRPFDPTAADGTTASLSANDSTAGSLAGKLSSTASSSLECSTGMFSST